MRRRPKNGRQASLFLIAAIKAREAAISLDMAMQRNVERSFRSRLNGTVSEVNGASFMPYNRSIRMNVSPQDGLFGQPLKSYTFDVR